MNKISKHKANPTIAIVGLGYVGLPLAIAFAEKYQVIGFDICSDRIKELISGKDHTREVDERKLSSSNIIFSSNPSCLKNANIIIIAVPTPIDKHRNPDLSPVISATGIVGHNMQKNCIVVYESTVYPGLTEEICIPLLENESGLKLIEGFTVGYSPERINPGDKINTLTTIKKIVSASDEDTACILETIYGSIIKAGIHKASSIKVAEAAKVIENIQRDINIALMNELAMIFEKMNINTYEVLEAAGSKWNFLQFCPGLVGGHCISVDPYYLTYKSEELGLHPEVILSGRKINDNFGKFIAETLIKQMIKNDIKINYSKVGILGLTFKENVPDLRNTRVIDIIDELKNYGIDVVVNDPEANKAEAEKNLKIELLKVDEFNELDAIIVAVPHEKYKQLTSKKIKNFYRNSDKAILYDIKNFFKNDPLIKTEFIYITL